MFLYLSFRRKTLSMDSFRDFSASSSYLSRLFVIYTLIPLVLKFLTISWVTWTEENTSMPGMVLYQGLEPHQGQTWSDLTNPYLILCLFISYKKLACRVYGLTLHTLNLFLLVLSTISILSTFLPNNSILQYSSY